MTLIIAKSSRTMALCMSWTMDMKLMNRFQLVLKRPQCQEIDLNSLFQIMQILTISK